MTRVRVATPEEVAKRGFGRFYIDTETRQLHPSVTSIIDMLPKPFLTRWAASMAAEYAVRNLDAVTLVARDNEKAAINLISGASSRYNKDRRDIGTEAHDLFELMIRGKNVGRVSLDMVPYRDNFDEFLQAVQPELISAEDVTWSDTHGYAGSFDALLRVRVDESGHFDPSGETMTILADWKTSKHAYASVALQLCAYSRADKLFNSDGTESPMPPVDGAAVLHIKPDLWSFIPVCINDDVFAVFKHLRAVYDWENDLQKRVLAKPVAGRGSFQTGSKRRR